jgi:hypothetical protein
MNDQLASDMKESALINRFFPLAFDEESYQHLLCFLQTLEKLELV